MIPWGDTVSPNATRHHGSGMTRSDIMVGRPFPRADPKSGSKPSPMILIPSVESSSPMYDGPLIPGPSEVINYYLLSLASADLLCGLLVVPLSVYPALVRRWVYGDIVCRLVGYLEVTLWAVSVYTFMWISVDRYLAIR